MKVDFNSGGAKVIDRIIIAYGFKTKLQLCNHLGVSSANLSMRYKRDFFPSDLVVRCIADTGVSLEWLVTGNGSFQDGNVSNYDELKAMEICHGKLQELPTVVLDKALLPKQETVFEIIKMAGHFYVVTRSYEDIFSGKYLVEIEGRIGIYDLQRYPVNMLKISGGSLVEPIDCKLDDVSVLAKVVSIIYEL